MKGQIGQLKHFFIPLFSLLVLVGALATFDRIILSPIVLGFLNATRGGAGKTSLRWGSLLIITRQCLLRIFWIEGNWGLYVITKIALLEDFSFITFLRLLGGEFQVHGK